MPQPSDSPTRKIIYSLGNFFFLKMTHLIVIPLLLSCFLSFRFFPSLIEYMLSGPVVCMVWTGSNAVKIGRILLGEVEFQIPLSLSFPSLFPLLALVNLILNCNFFFWLWVGLDESSGISSWNNSRRLLFDHWPKLLSRIGCSRVG